MLIGAGLVFAAVGLALFASSHEHGFVGTLSLAATQLRGEQSNDSNSDDVSDRKQSLRDALYRAFGLTPSDEEEPATALAPTPSPTSRTQVHTTRPELLDDDDDSHDSADSGSTSLRDALYKVFGLTPSEAEPAAADLNPSVSHDTITTKKSRTPAPTLSANRKTSSKTQDKGNGDDGDDGDGDDDGSDDDSAESLRDALYRAFGLTASEMERDDAADDASTPSTNADSRVSDSKTQESERPRTSSRQQHKD